MSTANKYDQEGIEKIRELAKSIDFTMMATNLGKKPFHAIPMSTKKVDDEGRIWFLSNKNSDHNHHISVSNETQLIYSDPGSFEFLTIYGFAKITTDKSIIEELYGSGDDAWFDGVDDPNITAISVHPEKAHYWDSKHNKLISLLKMGFGALTGDQPDLGEEGDIVV